MFKTPILNAIEKYKNQQVLRYDVPGHKGNPKSLGKFCELYGDQVVKLDLNSMEALDNMNQPLGVIKETQKQIAKLHGSDQSKILTNGTTSGIQMMILATTNPGEKILIPRNAHKSVTTGIIMSGAIPIYFYPLFDEKLGIYTEVTLTEIQRKIEENPEVKTILLINPSYYGICGEFQEIVKFCKSKEKLVIVDEAHGGQFNFNDQNITAMNAGADLSCISYHKTLGSLTQSSVLLYRDNKKFTEKLNFFYQALNTTSPSYLFIGSIEGAAQTLSISGEKEFLNIEKEVTKMKKKINRIPGFEIIDQDYFRKNKSFFDFSKLLIKVEHLNLTGFEVYRKLREEYNIQIELAEFNLILLISGSGEQTEKLNYVYEALEDISKNYYNKKNSNETKLNMLPLKKEEQPKALREIFYKNKTKVNLEKALNQICGESIMIYPPGIDIIKLGEKFDIQTIKYIQNLIDQKIPIMGLVEGKVSIIEE